MKKGILVLLPILLFTFSACEKAAELTKFDMAYESSVTIPSQVSVITSPLTLTTPPVTTNAEQRFSNNNTRPDLVEAVYLKSAILEVTMPEGEDFSFLSAIEVFIEADGLPKELVASLDPVPTDAGTTITLQTEGVDLREYIIKDQFTVSTSVTTDEILNNDHEIKINTVFEVDAKILGL